MNDGTDYLTAAVAFAAVGTSALLFPTVLTVVVVSVTAGFFGYRWWARRHRPWIPESPRNQSSAPEQGPQEGNFDGA